jgi:hypothetical protein
MAGKFNPKQMQASFHSSLAELEDKKEVQKNDNWDQKRWDKYHDDEEKKYNKKMQEKK